MDSSFVIKPRDTVSRLVYRRGNIVRTDLSPSLSVNSAPQGSQLHHSGSDGMMRDPSLDAQCQSLLDHEREKREHRERQRPRKDEALMRQRAYGRGVDHPASHHIENAQDSDETLHADIQV